MFRNGLSASYLAPKFPYGVDCLIRIVCVCVCVRVCVCACVRACVCIFTTFNLASTWLDLIDAQGLIACSPAHQLGYETICTGMGNPPHIKRKMLVYIIQGNKFLNASL